jgi:NADPH:quinone reductase-like Zn-dependent oxidoreductase
MRVITQQTLGGPEVLTIVDAPEPQPLPTEVLVRVKAIGLNPLEARLRAGEFPLIGQPPFILGWDISGVVEEAPQTWRFRPGDEVFGMPLFPRAASAYAEVVSAPALHLARKPASLPHVEASALPADPGQTAVRRPPRGHPWPCRRLWAWQSESWKEAIRVFQFPVPSAGWYWLVYQNVQSSTGSIAMEV